MDGSSRGVERVEDSGELAAGQDQSSAFMFAYVDKVCDVLVEEFGSERERSRGRTRECSK